MKWTIRIELTPEGNEPMTCDVDTMTRPIADLHPEQVGPSHEEGRQAFGRFLITPPNLPTPHPS